jgi:hypothetical protein
MSKICYMDRWGKQHNIHQGKQGWIFRRRLTPIFSLFLCLHCVSKPIAVAARSKAWTVFALSNSGVVGSNLTRGMDVCVRLFVILCVGKGFRRADPPSKESYRLYMRLRNWKSGQDPTKDCTAIIIIIIIIIIINHRGRTLHNSGKYIIYNFLHTYVYLWLYSPCGPWPLFFSFLIYTHSVGFLGRGISPSQGRYLHTEQHKHRINAHRHPCLEWD